jgi:hypothetical protein
MPNNPNDIPDFVKMIRDELVTEKIEEIEVAATLSNTLLGEINNVEDYLVKHHQFLSGIPYRVYVNYAKRTHTYTQRQRRIIKKPQDKYEYFKEMGQEYPGGNNPFLEEYLKYFGQQQPQYSDKAKEILKQATEDFLNTKSKLPEPEKLNPLKFFSPTDLT